MTNTDKRTEYQVWITSLLGVLLAISNLCPSAQAKLQIHLEMENNLNDSAGRDHDGVLVDGYQGFNAFVPGIIGQALELGNVNPDPAATNNDYVRIPYTMMETGAVAFWFKVDTVYNYVTLFDNTVNQDDWEMWIYATGVARFRIQSGSEVSANLHGLAPDGNAAGDWFHIAVTWQKLSPTTVENSIYVNGRLIESRQGPWVDPGAALFLGGGHAGNDAGIGTWDDVRVYDNALEEPEIRWLARHVLVVDPPQLRLKEGQSAPCSVSLDCPPGYEPVGDVSVTVTPDMSLALNGLPAGQPAILTFKPESFTTPQTVTVLAVDDAINTDDRIATLTHAVSSDDSRWNGMQAVSVSVFILEDDLGCGAWGFMPMDFNRDCYVNLADFADFASQWMECTDPSASHCQAPPRVTIVAHRGYSHAAPENTIASCNAARGFAEMVEFDVRTTSDGWLVLMHDGTLDRTTNGTGAVESQTMAQLRPLDAGSWFSAEFAGERIPTMSEAILAILPDMVPFIERKTGTAEQYMDVLRALRCINDVVVIAFDWDFLARLEDMDSTIITGALGSGDLLDDDIAAIRALGIDLIDWEHSTITAAEVNNARAAGLELWVWTVNDPGRIGQLLDIGIDGITTDNPELARQLRDQR